MLDPQTLACSMCKDSGSSGNLHKLQRLHEGKLLCALVLVTGQEDRNESLRASQGPHGPQMGCKVKVKSIKIKSKESSPKYVPQGLSIVKGLSERSVFLHGLYAAGEGGRGREYYLQGKTKHCG